MFTALRFWPAFAHYWHIVLIVSCASLAHVHAQYRCKNPNRRSGYCVSIYECPSLLEVIQNLQLSNSQIAFVQQSTCEHGFGNRPYVCCTPDQNFSGGMTAKPTTTTTEATLGQTTSPTSTTKKPTTTSTNISPASPSDGKGNVLPQPPNCGHDVLSDRIYNGNDTTLDEFPWMVLLSYTNATGHSVLNCGGSLINQRYVLTAAHCVKGAIEVQVGPLSTVRLGEYDITTPIDCIDSDCNDEVLELGFEEIVVHPEYVDSSAHHHHDIALVRLNADVRYTDFIKPVCLPVPKPRSAIMTGESLVVAGWGRTLLARQSNVKKKLAIPVNDQHECERKFSTKKINVIGTQLCVGGEFIKDSCDGDSGGPLMRLEVKPRRWVQEGIVSFGNLCGLEDWPGVYTRVSEYMDWIQENLKP